MDVYPQSRVWPYLLAIVILIALVIGVPIMMRPSARNTEFWVASESALAKNDSVEAILEFRPYTRPEEVKIPQPIEVVTGAESSASTTAAVSPTSAPDNAPAEITPLAIDDELNRSPSSTAKLVADQAADQIDDGVGENELHPEVITSSTNTAEEQLASTSAPDLVAQPETESFDAAATKPSVDPTNDKAGLWTNSERFAHQLRILDGTRFERWAREVARQVERVRQADSLDSSEAGDALQRLDGLKDSANRGIARSTRFQPLLRPNYSIERRLAIWHEARTLLKNQPPTQPPYVGHLRLHIAAVRQTLDSSVNGRQWDSYLQLDTLYGLASEGDTRSWSTRADIAAVSLSRMRSQDLSPQQRRLMARPEFQAFARELRGWIAAGVDLPDLIEAVEAYASAPTSDADARLVSHYLRLRETPGHEALLQAFETHYRNANCRVSISRDLIERLVPSLSRIASGISQEIEGVQVRGKNHGWTRFTVQLVPDDQRIRMNLLAHGEIRSRTVSSKGPVRLFNTGRSQFAAQKQLIIDADGLHVTRADADARSGLNLNDIETDFDGVPLLGWMVRQVAKQEHDDQQGMFRWRVQRRVAQSARHRLDQEFDGRISGAEDRLDQSILSPLRKLQLDPTSMELRTTTNRVVVRGRLSSETQLASYSPRPRALRDSLMSTQIHQSTINNLIDQLNVGGELRNIEELLTEIASKLGRDPQLPEDVPKNVLVRLAKRKPIRVDFDENRAMLTLNVAELRKGKRKWRNFVVRGYYRIDSHDKGLSMTRDQSIELISERLGFRDRLAVRAIFTKAMARNHELQLIANELSRNPRLSKLTITQLVSRDGWLGVSLGEPKMPLVANERIDGRR